jgi:hypothetical protein
MNPFQRLVAGVLIASTALMGLPMTAQAGIVQTDEVVAAGMSDANRDKVTAFLARQDIRSALQAQGLDSAAASDRVKALSDAEVAQLASRVDQAPAGGEVLSLLFTLFIVLLVTDIMGLTKVFPFTRSVR